MTHDTGHDATIAKKQSFGWRRRRMRRRGRSKVKQERKGDRKIYCNEGGRVEGKGRSDYIPRGEEAYTYSLRNIAALAWVGDYYCENKTGEMHVTVR
jgi:hypothetical protein